MEDGIIVKHMNNSYDDGNVVIVTGEEREQEQKDEEEERRRRRMQGKEEAMWKEQEKSHAKAELEEGKLHKNACTLPGYEETHHESSCKLLEEEEGNLHKEACTLPGYNKNCHKGAHTLPEYGENLQKRTCILVLGKEEKTLHKKACILLGYGETLYERSCKMLGQEDENHQENAHEVLGEEEESHHGRSYELFGEEEEEEEILHERAHEIPALHQSPSQILSWQGVTGEKEEENLQRLAYIEAALEVERIASSTAAIEAMAMIARLQEEKATALMEARWCRSDAEERETHTREALAILKDALLVKEAELRGLQEHIETLYRKISLFTNSEYGDQAEFLEKVRERHDLVERLFVDGNGEDDIIRWGNEFLLVLRLLMEKLGEKSGHDNSAYLHGSMQNGGKKIEQGNSILMILDRVKQLEERFTHCWQQHTRALDYEQIISNWIYPETNRCAVSDSKRLFRWTKNPSNFEEGLLEDGSLSRALNKLGSHALDLSKCSPLYANNENVVMNNDVEKNVMEQHRSSCPSIDEDTNDDSGGRCIYDHTRGYYYRDIGNSCYHREESIGEGVHDVYEVQIGESNLNSFVHQSNTIVEQDQYITGGNKNNDVVQISLEKQFNEEELKAIIVPNKNHHLVDYSSFMINEMKFSQKSFNGVDGGHDNYIYQLKERLKALEKERVSMEQVMESLRKENRNLKLLQGAQQYSQDSKGDGRRRDQMETRARRQVPLLSSVFKNLFTSGSKRRYANGIETSSGDALTKQVERGLLHLLNKPLEALESVHIKRGRKVNLANTCMKLRNLHPSVFK